LPIHYFYCLYTTFIAYTLLVLPIHYVYCLYTTFIAYTLPLLPIHYFYCLYTTFIAYALPLLPIHYVYCLYTTLKHLLNCNICMHIMCVVYSIYLFMSGNNYNIVSLIPLNGQTRVFV